MPPLSRNPFVALCFFILSSLSAAEPADQELADLLERAEALWAQRNYAEARSLSEQSLLLIRPETPKSLRAEALLFHGRLAMISIGPADLPTRDFLESLSLFRELGDSAGIARAQLQLGVVNYDMENYAEAVDHLQQCLQYSAAGSFREGLSYYLLALCRSEMGQFDTALTLFDTAAAVFGPDQAFMLLQIETFRGKLRLNEGRPEAAKILLRNLIEEQAALIERENYSPAFAYLASAYLGSGEPGKALAYAHRARQLSQGIGVQQIYYREALEVLHQAFFTLGNGDSAYHYLQALSAIKDSVANKQIVQQVAKLSGQYQFDLQMDKARAQQELNDALTKARISRSETIRNFVGGGFLLAVLAAGIFLRQKTSLSKEKRRSDNLLLNILPREVADELKQSGRARARHYPQVTILFIDIVGFTQKAEVLDPEELVAEINLCFEAFDELVEKHGLEKIKTIGDAYLAAGGLPLNHPKSAANAVRAALDMQGFMLELEEKRRGTSKTGFRIRAGLHTGPVVAGVVGKKKFQYDLWGDTVNTASRMEQNCETGLVNISEATYRLVVPEPDLYFTPRGSLPVKGKGEMSMWYVSHAAGSAQAV